MITPRAVAEPGAFAEAVLAIEQALSPQVVRLQHTIYAGADGSPSVAFHVIIEFTEASALPAVTDHISSEIRRIVRPEEDWGVTPFFYYQTTARSAR
jgi:hypothetical protein